MPLTRQKTARPLRRSADASSSTVFARPTVLALALHGALAIGAVALPLPALAQSAPANAPPAGDAVKNFDVPAGPMVAALNRFARTAGVNLAYDPALLEGLSTKGLSGSHSVATGLSLLLDGTGLEAVAQTGGGYQVRRATVAVTLAKVSVIGQADGIGGLKGTYSGGQLARGGNLGVLGIQDLMDVPFSTTNYTSELIANQQGLTVSDVVMNDASVRTLQARGGYGEDYQVRGFPINARDVGVNGLYGLSPNTRMPLEMVERVEVLKGPGSFLSGVGPSGSIGGGINVVTKRGTDVPLTRLTATYMGKAQFGTHMDVGRRFGEDNEWGVRVNGLLRDGEGNVDGGNQRVGLGSLGVDYAGARLRWSADLLYVNNETQEFRPQTAFLAGITQVPKVPDARKSYYPGADMEDQSKMAITRLEFDITPDTTVYGGIGYTDNTSEQNFPTASSRVNSAGDFTVRNGYYDEYNKTLSADTGVRTRFKTGSIGHTAVLAASKLQRETGYFYQLTDAPGVASNLYDPAPLPTINFARGTPTKSAESELSSLALVDTLSFVDDSLLVSLGARNQRINQKSVNGSTPYDESAVTPLVGVVVKPNKNTSVYGNYTAGLQAGGIAAPARANAGEVFAPQKSNQIELGAKYDWGRLMTQASIYQIERPNSMTDPVTNIYSFDGEQRNRGLELTAYGEVTRGLRLMASAAFNDAKMTKTAGGVNQGKDATGVPDRTFNAGLDWDTPWVQGLSLNGRVIHTSSMWYDAANTLRMPSWTRLDLGARYKTTVADKPVVLRANLENVTDEAYWVTASGYVTVGAPRTLMLSAQVDF
ncbi:TonB-dependent siderophore receptor [Hylemonella sp. W303a]|uniref:TonB-dependent siderophore receptor n=1 Tax=Hylemonella sp. W303a TaxID=3389873 RepID=UPI00396B3B31